jgi:hydroxymethylpyrimidine/phosphomethylpyrimidine kinase
VQTQQSALARVADLPPSLLCVAGSDSGGGAGIQADLGSAGAQGVHVLTAITALTAQNTRGVRAIHVPPDAFLRAQFEALLEDFRIGAVKIGMLGSRSIISCVAELLDRLPGIPVILDPVMVSGTGAPLLPTDAMQALRERLLPRCTLLTPNLHEAELLLGVRITDAITMRDAAAALRALGPQAVLLKGGHLELGDQVCDLLLSPRGERCFTHPRLPRKPHGTGCSLASTVAARMVLGDTLEAACELACEHVHQALRLSYRPGLGGLDVLQHGWRYYPRSDVS